MNIKSAARIVFAVTAFILAVMILIIIIQPLPWSKLDESPYCENLSQGQIDSIRLIRTPDSGMYVEFEDSDLVAEWTDYFKALEVKRLITVPNPFAPQSEGGECPTVQVNMGGKSYYFHFENEGEIEFGNARYKINNNENGLFDRSYAEAEERYGIQTI